MDIDLPNPGYSDILKTKFFVPHGSRFSKIMPMMAASEHKKKHNRQPAPAS